MRLVIAAYTNEEVADRLFTSWRTGEGHPQSMIDKIGSPNSLALFAFAVRSACLTNGVDPLRDHFCYRAQELLICKSGRLDSALDMD